MTQTIALTDAGLQNIKNLAATERILRQGDPYYEGDECSTYDHEVTPDVVAGLCYEIERLRRATEDAPGTHEFTGRVKRSDGVAVTATITVPHGHPLTAERKRPWHVETPATNFLELGELAMMAAQRGYSILESNTRSREHWTNRDYWADLLDAAPPVLALEAGK